MRNGYPFAHSKFFRIIGMFIQDSKFFLVVSENSSQTCRGTQGAFAGFYWEKTFNTIILRIYSSWCNIFLNSMKDLPLCCITSLIQVRNRDTLVHSVVVSWYSLKISDPQVLPPLNIPIKAVACLSSSSINRGPPDHGEMLRNEHKICCIGLTWVSITDIIPVRTNIGLYLIRASGAVDGQVQLSQVPGLGYWIMKHFRLPALFHILHTECPDDLTVCDHNLRRWQQYWSYWPTFPVFSISAVVDWALELHDGDIIISDFIVVEDIFYGMDCFSVPAIVIFN